MKRLLFCVNVDWFFISHRLPIAMEAIDQGFEVHIATTITDQLNFLKQKGLIVHHINLHRSYIGISIFSELWSVFSIIKKVKPDILHLVTIKPVLFGGISARFAKVPAVVSAISGLGFIFNGKGFVHFLQRKLTSWLYIFSLGHNNQKIIFQNSEDKFKLSSIKSSVRNRSIVLPGSGVDLSLFSVVENNLNTPTVMMASRLLSSKGVREFIKASKIVYENNKNVRFILVGEIDPLNPESIKKSELDQWKNEKIVEIWGYRDEMYNVISKANIIVLPSYYGEGLPRVLIESAACGRAVITTDHPGCRDAIRPETGILVPIKDPVALADAIQNLLKNPKKIVKMGEAGRKLAEQRYSIESVCDAHMKIYQELLSEDG
jgi:glycosyltransferase involved in cell wall biosynthesis